MSMDEQYDQMVYFTRALIDFNEHLRASVNDLQQQHDIVSPHWQDEMRRHYDRVWDPFHEQMRQYITREAPSYVEFLSMKARALERYLHGGSY
jgi:hypothetical protein